MEGHFDTPPPGAPLSVRIPIRAENGSIMRSKFAKTVFVVNPQTRLERTAGRIGQRFPDEDELPVAIVFFSFV